MRPLMVLALLLCVAATTVYADEGAAAGDAVFQNCMACHGDQGQGDEDNEAPRLAGQHSWYLVTQLENFRAGRRGAHEEDYNGQLMKAMAAALSDEDIEAVVAYIATLPTE